MTRIYREDEQWADGQKRVWFVTEHDDGTVTKIPWYLGWANAIRACAKPKNDEKPK